MAKDSAEPIATAERPRGGPSRTAAAQALPPLIILAPPRSFTSLVNAVIGQHPRLYGMPELNLFQCGTMQEFVTGRDPDGTVKSPFWRVMRDGLLRVVAQLYGGEQTMETIDMADRWVRARHDWTCGEVYQELCAKVAPLRIVEKSPAYLRKREFLDRIRATFPDCRFIHLTRHPRGQCASALAVKGGSLSLFLINSIDYTGPEPVLDPQILWHDTHIQILNFLDDIPRAQWLHVQGERLLNNLDAELARICDWLGIEADARALEAMKHPELSEYSNVGPANARLGNDINFLQAPKLRPGKIKVPSLEGPLEWRPDGKSFHARVAELAREFGYS